MGTGRPRRERKQGAFVSQCRRRDTECNGCVVCRTTRTGDSRIASRSAEGQRADRTNVQVGRAGRRRPRRTKEAGAQEDGVCSQVRAAREMGLTEWGQL